MEKKKVIVFFSPSPIQFLFRTFYKDIGEACDWDGQPVNRLLDGGEGQLSPQVDLPLMEEVFSSHWVHSFPDIPLPEYCQWTDLQPVDL